MKRRIWVALSLLFLGPGCVSRTVTPVDVCVYGGTSAGIAAAIQVRRMGRSVVIVEPGVHLGGLSTSGLGATDIGRKEAIGGIAREFYGLVGKHYGQEEAWKFEPHVARDVFIEMLRDAKVLVFFGHALESVEMAGGSIVEISTAGSRSFRAKVFIDATYEGDLMARAGVAYTVGREPNSRHGETLGGVRGETPKHQFLVPVDPWVTPGDPSSGLLSFIEAGELGVPGSGDESVQAYNFRLCLTKDPANRVPIEPAADYDPARYELLARYLEALVKAGKSPRLDEFLSIIEVPNGKTDINNNGGFSTDYIGGNSRYPEADLEERERIRAEHEAYTRGFLHFLAESPRVPESLRLEMRSWGLSRDEFAESNHWPPQMYVREARRMVADQVMTERHCRGLETVPDPVGLGAYNMDSHNCRRIVRDGVAHNEGDVQVSVKPYGISYRAIAPRSTEASNLLVPVCLSATHIAYGSIRMEPVFMILGQSAATAACLAIESGSTVQDLPYAKLRERLLADAQRLEWMSDVGRP
jgi:hypothetical protein